MLSARLILVRHGQSTYNAEERLQGQADPPLSDAGRARGASGCAPPSAASPPSASSTSDLAPRARDRRAARLSRTRGCDPRWREIDVGEWDGRPLAEFPAETGGRVARRPAAPRPAASRGPRSQARVGGAFDELVAARRHLARRLPRRLRARGAVPRHRRRPPAARSPGRTRASRPSRSQRPPPAALLRLGGAQRGGHRQLLSSHLGLRKFPRNGALGLLVPSLGFVRDTRSEAGRPAHNGAAVPTGTPINLPARWRRRRRRPGRGRGRRSWRRCG